MEGNRFLIRKEFFGSVIYDRKEYKYLFADNLITNILIHKGEKNDEKINSSSHKDIVSRLLNLGFLDEKGKIYYKFLDNKPLDNILSAPLQVYYDFTDMCFLNCRHCYMKGNMSEENELTIEEIEKLSQMLKLYGVFKISLGGGEPLYHPNWFEIISLFREKDIDVSLSTNGLLLGNIRTIDKLNRLGLRTITISCEGGRKESFDYIRGKGTFEKLNTAMQIFKKYYKRRYAMRVTITSYTTREIKDIIDLAVNFGCYAVKFKYLQMLGNASMNKDLLPSKTEYNKAIDLALTYGKGKNIKIAVPRHYTKDMETKQVVNEYNAITVNSKFPINWGFHCSGGTIGIYITQHGFCTPCVSLGKAFWSGNVKYDDLLDVWENGKGFRIMRGLHGSEPCLSCKYLNFCKSGCRARALHLLGSLQAPDPYCPLVDETAYIKYSQNRKE